MTRPLSGLAVAWLAARALLAAAALAAAFVQAGPAAAAGLAALLAVVRPIRRGWIAAIPIAAIALAAPLAAVALAARALATEAILQMAGVGDDGKESGSAPLRRRRRGVGWLVAERLALARRLELPVSDSLAEARQRLEAAKTGPGSLEETAVAVAATAWAEARPWTLLRLLPELVVTVFAGVFDEEEGEPGGATPISLGRWLLLEMFGPGLVNAVAILCGAVLAAIVFPTQPISLGPLTLPGPLVQGLAVVVLSLATVTRSCGGFLIAAALAAALVGSQVVEAAAVAVVVGLAASAGRSALEGIAVSGSSGRLPREPYRGPWRLRGHWRAATQAGQEGRLPVAIALFEELLASPRCTEKLRLRARAGLALRLYEAGHLDRAAEVLVEIPDSAELPPQALPDTGAVAAALGDLDRAERLLRQALSTLPRRSALRYQASLSLADVLSRQGDPDGAIAVLEAQRGDPWGYGGIVQLLESEGAVAAALSRQGDLQRAQRRLEEILERGPIEPSHAAGLSRELRESAVRAEGRLRLVAGEVALAQGRFSAAEDHLGKTLGRLPQDREPHLYGCARALHGVARVFQGRGEKGAAEVLEGARLLEARRTQLRRGDHRTGLILAETSLYSWCLRAFEHAAGRGAPAAAGSAAWLIESLQKSALSQMLRGEGVDLPAPAQRLVERIAALEHGAGADVVATAGDDAEVEARIARTRTELAALSAAFAEAYVPESTSVEALAEIARRYGDALSFYLPGGGLPGWRAWAKRDGSFEIDRVEVSDPASADLLAQLAAGDAAGIAALHAPLHSSAAGTWRTLAQALLPSELAASLAAGRNEGRPQPLLIAPDGVLGLLPWSGLLLDHDPLGTLAAIQIIPSLGLLEGAEEPLTARSRAASAVAHLDRGLDGQASERMLLERSFELSLTNSREEFLAALQEGDHQGAYLAAHGDGLGLEQHVEFEDGPLTAGAALQAPWPEWTIFASCLVGRVPMRAGQEPLGLPISCVLAGSRSVLAAAVEVPSDSIPALAEPLLEALAEGDHPALALVKAQRRSVAADPQASVARHLAFLCLTRAPESTSGDAGIELLPWQEIVATARSAAEEDPARARSIYERAIARNREPPLLARYAEFLLVKEDDPDEAGRILAEGLEAHPDHLELLQLEAWRLAELDGETAGARIAFERVLAAHPDNRWAIGEFARFLWQNSEDDELEAGPFRRAVAVEPQRAGHAAALGYVLDRDGDLDGAREMYERALSIAPKRASTCRRLGNLVARTDGDVERVARLYERAIEIDPEKAASSFDHWAMTTFRDLGDRRLARQIFERGNAEHPDDPYLTVNLAWLLFGEGERQSATRLARRATELTDEPAIQLEAWFYLAALGEPVGLPEARRQVERLLGEGVRSAGWDFSEIVAQAGRGNDGLARWVAATAAAIAAPAETEAGS